VRSFLSSTILISSHALTIPFSETGAALYGAGITRGFRTKDIRVQDLTPYGIDVAYQAEKASAGTSWSLSLPSRRS
jgi:hypothetical protein